MTKHTKRDRVWDAALRLTERGKFTLEQVLDEAGLDESSERTTRDTLTTMVELGHLERSGWSRGHVEHEDGTRRYDNSPRRCWYGARVDYSGMDGYEETVIDHSKHSYMLGDEKVVIERPPWAIGDPSETTR